jgi:hypothetical protein
VKERTDSLTPEEQAAMAKTYAELTRPSEQMHRFEAEQKIQVSHEEVAERAPSNVKAAAFRLAKETRAKEDEAVKIARSRENVNYDYWQARCRIEQLPRTVAAREDVYLAKEKMKTAKLVEARQLFESAWQKWGGIFKEHTVLANRLTEDDLVEDIQVYMQLLEQLDEELPKEFILQDLLDKFPPLSPKEQPPSGSAAVTDGTPAEKSEEGAAAAPSKPDGDKPAEEKSKKDGDASTDTAPTADGESPATDVDSE